MEATRWLATRWLGVWLDSKLTLKESHAIQPKKGLRRLTGQMGLSLVNCLKLIVSSLWLICRYFRRGALER